MPRRPCPGPAADRRRKYPEAAKLVGAKVMAKPLRRCRTRRSATRADVSRGDAVEDYRRELDLTTATAHVSYTSDGVTFTREVFASAPDQVIVVRLTAGRPGQHLVRGAACRRRSGRRSRRPPDGDS